MEAVIGFCLQVLAFLFLITAGGLIISFFLDVVISLFDEHEGVYVNKNKCDKKETKKSGSVVADKDKIVVYKDLPGPEKDEPKKKEEIVNGEVVSDIDYDKAAEEQRMLMSKNGGAPAPQNYDSRPQFNQPQPEKNPVFMDDEDEEDDEYASILDEVVTETKKQIKDEKNGGKKKKAPVVVEDDEDLNELVEEEKPAAPQKRKVIYKERTPVDDQTKAEREKELQELKEIKEQQKQELEEFRRLKEEFAKGKEEELLAIKNDGDPSDDQGELDRLRAELEAERAEIERLREELNKEPEAPVVPETIVQEKIIRDDEEIKRLKLKNLERMNARLTRILKSVDKVEEDKKKLLAKQEEQKKRLEEKKKYEEQLRQQKQIQLELAQKEYEKQKEKKEKEAAKQREERETLKRKQEEQRSVELAKKEELKKRLLEPLEKKPSKYNLSTGSKKSAKAETQDVALQSSNEEYTETVVTEEVETVTHETTNHGTAKSKSVVKPSRATNDEVIVKEVVIENQKPLYGKDYYEKRLLELAEEMKESEKELRVNKQEYIPLTRIHRAYARDSEKLRKKELIVAKQKVALYGVNASKIDPVKKEKLNESLKQLAELKDSVEHCKEIIKKNKDRYPILEKNNKLIVKHIAKIQEEIDTCNKAIEYYDKKKK